MEAVTKKQGFRRGGCGRLFSIPFPVLCFALPGHVRAGAAPGGAKG